MGTVDKIEITVPFTAEEFEAAYVMWRSGANMLDLARGFGTEMYTMDWMFIQRAAGYLDRYAVHYKDSNQPTI